MIRVASLLAILATLAACGVDGEPERPRPGVTMTGDSRVGVVLN